MSEQSKDQSHDSMHGIPIKIDNEPFKAPRTPMTGSELRTLPNPDVPSDRDLWLEHPGPAEDDLVAPEQSIDLKPGMHFYTAPRDINPGNIHYATAR